MKRSRRVIALNMFWSLLSLCINYLMNFLITPYVTNNIGVEAYGFVALANTFISYVDILAVGLNAFAGRFIAMAYYQKKLEKANRYFSSTILADLILACVLLAGGTVAIVRLDRMLQIPQELTADVKLLFFIVLMRYLLTLLRTAFDAAAFISERIDLAEKLQSAAYLLQAGLLLALCLLLQPHVWYVGLAAAVGALLLLAGNLRLCHKLTPELQFHVKDFSPHAVWEVLSTGSWTALNNLGNLLNSGLDLLITNLMLNATVMGQISVAKSLETIVSGMIMKISTVFRPRCLRLYAEDKMEELTGLLKISMRCTGGFCNLVVMGFFVCGHDFMALWLPGQNTDFLFRAGLIVLLSDIATGAVQPLYYVYTLTQKLRLPCCVTILMGTANVLSMYILLRYTSVGAYAVLLTTLVISVVHFVDAPLYAAHCLHLPLHTFYPTLVCNGASLAAGFAAAEMLRRILPAAGSWGTLMFKALTAATVLLPIVVLILLPPQLWKSLGRRFIKLNDKGGTNDGKNKVAEHLRQQCHAERGGGVFAAEDTAADSGLCGGSEC